jgi:SHS family lactate transporter-like MFS transporter
MDNSLSGVTQPPSATVSAKPYARRERLTILAFAFIGTVFDGADFSIFLFFMVPLAAHLHVSIVEVSMIQASSYVVGIIGGVCFGSIADRWGRRVGLTLSVATFGIFTFLTAFTTNYPMLLAVRVLAGIGIGGEAGIAFAYVNEAFPGRDDRRGLLSGLLRSMFLVGGWVAALIYTITSAAFGQAAWHWAFGLLGLTALLSGAVRIFMPESRVWLAARAAEGRVEREARIEGKQSAAARRIPVLAMFSDGLAPRVICATLLMACGFYGAYAVLTYAPSMWQSIYHLPAAMVGRLGMIGSIAGIASYVIGGALSDWKGRRWAFGMASGFGVLAYGLFTLSALGVFGGDDAHGVPGWGSPIVVTYLMVQMAYGYTGVQGVWLSELFPTRVRTTAQNFVYYMGRAIGGGAAPLLGLLVSRALGLNLAFAVAFGLVGVLGCLLLHRLLPETRGRTLVT